MAPILYRGRQRGNPLPVLVLAPIAEQPAPASFRQLEHEYSLAAELDPAWAAQPLALTRHGGRTILVFRDPGGEPMMNSPPFCSVSSTYPESSVMSRSTHPWPHVWCYGVQYNGRLHHRPWSDRHGLRSAGRAFDKRREIVSVGVQVVAVPGPAGPALAAAVMSNAAVAAGGQKEHLVLNGVRTQWPSVAEDD